MILRQFLHTDPVGISYLLGCGGKASGAVVDPVGDVARYIEAAAQTGMRILYVIDTHKRIAFDGPSRMVIDGPFAETKELVAGYWLWEVKDMDEAVAWVKRCPNPMMGPSEIEIRPLYEMADFQ